MEQALFTENFFDSMINRVHDIVYQLDRDGRISFINKAVEKYGYRTEELVGTPFLEWVHPEDRKKATFRVNERRTGNRRTRSLEIRLMGKKPESMDGYKSSKNNENAQLFIVSAEGIYGENKVEAKNFMGTQGTARYISHEGRTGTQRPPSHDGLFKPTGLDAENERKGRFLFSVLESLPHPFYVIDASDYRVLLANSAAKQGLGAKNTTCYALTHKRDRPCSTPENPCPVEIIRETKEPVSVEHIHYGEDNIPRFFRINAYPVFDKNGDVSQVIESSIDITDQKKIEKNLRDSEKKFRAVAQSAKDAIVSADNESTIAFWNQSAEEMFGYSEAEMIGKPITLLMPERFKDAHLENMRQHVAGNGSPFIHRTLELVGLKKDGKEFPIELSIAAWTVGEESFYTGIIRDISERKQIEKERENLISDLQKALAKVKTLSGLLPICSSCKKIRDDKGYWNQIETYIHEHSGADFSHGICPECAQQLYPEVHKNLG